MRHNFNLLITRISLVAFIFLLLITIGTLTLACHQPDDPLLLDFSRCDDRVCLLGIAPTVTTYTVASAILAFNLQVERTTTNSVIADKRTEPYYQLTLYQDVNTVTVAEIDLFFNRLRVLTVSQIVAKFGLPCSVIPRYIPQNILLMYPGMVVYLEASRFTNSRPVAFSSRITQINLLNNNIHDCSMMTFGEDILAWRGFRVY